MAIARRSECRVEVVEKGLVKVPALAQALIVLTAEETSSWRRTRLTVHELCSKSESTSGILIAFLNAEDTTSIRHTTAHHELTKSFQIPSNFWGDLCQEASGYFQSTEHRSVEGVLDSHSTSFRFLIKHAIDQHDVTDEQFGRIHYTWYKLGFFTRWRLSGSSICLCFDLPTNLRESICQSLTSASSIDLVGSPLAMHAMLLEHIVTTFDRAVWSCRDLVRGLERNRPNVDDPKPDYVRMHEISRHAIHSTEMLKVSLKVVDSMLDECRSRHPVDVPTLKKLSIERTFLNHKSLLECLSLRSQALEDRLRNEINLAFNMNAQHDSMIAKRIAEATQADSAVMKTISVLGLAFLPGTFISAIFSMSFFNFTPATDGEPERWTVSTKFWMYWVVAIPITAATVGIWMSWQTRQARGGAYPCRKKSNHSDPKHAFEMF